MCLQNGGFKCKHKIPKHRERCLNGVKKAKLLKEHVERAEKQFAAIGLPSYSFEEFLNAPTSWTPTTKSPKTTASPSMVLQVINSLSQNKIYPIDLRSY